MSAANVDRLAKIIWNYACLNQPPVKSDAVLAFCSHDTRVADRAAQLVRDGYGRYLVISGGYGAVTRHTFTAPEAHIYRKIAVKAGVLQDQIIVEDKSTNSGENVTMSYAAVKHRGLHFDSVILVHKPYMERRVYATFKKQWPDSHTLVSVTSPQFDYDHYFVPVVPKQLGINLMVGDLLRLKTYAVRGFQIEQTIPAEVWDAAQQLVKLGYGHPISRD